MKFINPRPSAPTPDRPEIEYPCLWTYKVIGVDRSLLQDVIIETCSPHAVLVSPSHTSSKGKYHSLNAELVVPDEKTRLRIYEILKNHAAVKLVL